jgi:hypothetical protein
MDKKRKAEIIKRSLRAAKAIGSPSLITNESDPEKAVKSIARNKIRELKAAVEEIETEDGRKVLEEFPIPKEIEPYYEALLEQRKISEQAMYKIKHMSEGFWARIREHFDMYGNNLHINSKRRTIQVTEEEEEDED